MGARKKGKGTGLQSSPRYEWKCWSPFVEMFPPVAEKRAPAASGEGAPGAVDILDCSSSDDDIDAAVERSGLLDEACEADSSDDDEATAIQGLCAQEDLVDCTAQAQVPMMRDAVARQKTMCAHLSRNMQFAGAASEAKELSDGANSNGAEGLNDEEDAQMQHVLLHTLQDVADLDVAAAALTPVGGVDTSDSRSMFDRFAMGAPESREAPRICHVFNGGMKEAEMAKSLVAAQSRPLYAVQSGTHHKAGDARKSGTWMCAATVRDFPMWKARRDAFQNKQCCRAVFQTQTVTVRALRRGS